MDAILPLIGVVIGGVLVLSAPVVTHHPQRRERAQDRRAEFQRETLLRLQPLMFDAGRIAGKVHSEYVYEAQQGGTYGNAELLDDELNEQFSLARIELHVLQVRVLDDKLRASVQAVQTCFGSVLDAKSSDEGGDLIARAAEHHISANKRLGELLRDLY